MYAAAAGNSTLGIPKKVGAEFVKTDKPGKLPMTKKKNWAKHTAAKADDKATKKPAGFSKKAHVRDLYKKG